MIVPGSVPTTPDVGGRADSSVRHAARDDGRGPVLSLDDHHRRVEARDLHRGVDHAIHQLLEVDRASELAEESVAAALLLGALERVGQLAGELVHLAAHLVDRADELLVLRAAAACRRLTTTATRPAAATRAAAMITIVVATR